MMQICSALVHFTAFGRIDDSPSFTRWRNLSDSFAEPQICAELRTQRQHHYEACDLILKLNKLHVNVELWA